MKKLLFLFSAGMILFACNTSSTTESSARNTDLFQQNLKGKVQSYTEQAYTVDSTGKSVKDSVMNVTELDEKGYSIKAETKDSTGKVKEETMLTRYEGGTPKEITTKTNGKQTKKFVIDLDSNKKFGLVKVYDSTEKMTSYYKEITQDEYENVLGATEYTPENKFKSSFAQTYTNGLYAGTVGKDSSGKESYRSTYKMDDKGNWIEGSETNVMKDTTKTTVSTYKYDSLDDKGNWTQRTQYNDKNKPVKIIKRTFTYYKD
ncbi:MAG: hypothetical protein ABJA57_05800 [Ginsengibacter sp.]